MQGCPQGGARRHLRAPTVWPVRETTDPDEIVRARLRAVLVEGARDEAGAAEPTPRDRAPISPPWAPQPADQYWADGAWPPSEDPGESSAVPSSAPPALRSANAEPPPVPPTLRSANARPFSVTGAAQAAGHVPEADYGPQSPEFPPVGGPPSISVAGAFGADGRSRRLLPFDPGSRGVRALAAVAVLVVVIAAFLAWRARPRVDPVAAAPPADPRLAAASAGDPDAGGVAGSSSAQVVVAVGGKVRRPGLVRLPPGSRVADALQAAGGAEPGVDVTALNLARKVVDGELILVGVTPSPGSAPIGGTAGQPTAGGAPAGAPINLNTATLADLDALPGVGPVLAQRILDAREAQGGFKSVSDLRKVDGIGDSRYEQLKDLVIV